jgi:hypothetical protein
MVHFRVITPLKYNLIYWQLISLGVRLIDAEEKVGLKVRLLVPLFPPLKWMK